MPRLILLILLLISQSVFAAHDGEREILQDSKRLIEQTRYLQQTLDSYTKYNRNYWDSNHDKAEEVKLLFSVNSFIATATQFNDLVDRNKIDYTYFELPNSFQYVLEDFIDMDEQIKLLDGQRRSRREFDRHFNLNAVRRDAEDIQQTLKRLSPIIKRIGPVNATQPSPALAAPETPAEPAARVTIEKITLIKADPRKPKYEITGQLVGAVSRARIITQRTFSSARKKNLIIAPDGKFKGTFRNYLNATSILLEIHFADGEVYSQPIDVK